VQNFEYCNKTKIIFGKGTEDKAGSETALYAKRILLHHSGGSTVRSGLIDKVKNSLKNAGVEWEELTGVQPNPRLSLVKKGIDIVKKRKTGIYSGGRRRVGDRLRKSNRRRRRQRRRRVGFFRKKKNHGQSPACRYGCHHTGGGKRSEYKLCNYQRRRSVEKGHEFPVYTPGFFRL